jgi:hypothetical protein
MFKRCLVAGRLASAMVVILVEPAHAGTIRIENDLNRCYAQIPPSSTATLRVVYYPSARATAITGAEFRIEIPANQELLVSVDSLPSGATVVGGPLTGVRVDLATCSTAWLPVHLLTVRVLATNSLRGQRWHLLGRGPEGACPNVFTCDATSSVAPVLGGDFTINSSFVTICDPEPCLTLPVEASTWGAIKSVYR